MALLLEQIEWAERPVLPIAPHDPAWEAQVVSVTGSVLDFYKRISPSIWLRQAALDGQRVPVVAVPQKFTGLIHLVVSQESSCRYCYGTARAMLTLFGFPEDALDRIEREAQLAEADALERAFLQFCRRLARSNPRPARKDGDQLVELGFSPQAVAETAFLVGMCCFSNRMATLSAMPPAMEYEQLNTSWRRLLRPYYLWRFSRRPPEGDFPDPPRDGAFEGVIAPLRGIPAAGVLHKFLSLAFASPVLPLRTKALMFAVVARSLMCKVTEPAARRLLAEEGVPEALVDEVLATLTSKSLDKTEARLIPWVRDTVRYQQPLAVQEHTRQIVEEFGVEVALEAIGTAALANATARIAMLAQ